MYFSNLTCFYQNVRGLRTKTKIFYNNLVNKDYDIICLSETWLLPGIFDAEIFDSRYNIYRTDRNYEQRGMTKGGGTLIAVKRELMVDSHCSSVLPQFPDADITHLDILLSRGPNAKRMHVYSCYFPDTKDQVLSQQTFLELVSDFSVDRPEDEFLIIGDFNIRNAIWLKSQDIARNDLILSNPSVDVLSSQVYTFMYFTGFLQYNGIMNYNDRHLDLVFSSFLCRASRADPLSEPEDRHHPSLLLSLEESSPPPPLSGDDFISPAELRKSALRLNKRKAPGPDNISSAAITSLPGRAMVTLTRIFNGILRTSHFPSAWKTGSVITLPKPGKDRRSPASYRPITLLSHLAKLFERLLLRRVRPLVPLRDEQFGFRSGHSTTLQLVRVLHMLADEKNQGHRSVGVFLDVEKAFDRVWHVGLLYKLKPLLPPALVHLIASFLRDRTFTVVVEGEASQPRSIRAGVPQGSCLSPTIYATYTNDIPTLRDHLREGERDVALALFADDSAFISSSRSVNVATARMQRLLNLLPPWLDRWRIAVNVGKTAAIAFGSGKPPPHLTLRDQDIAWETTVTYLGCRIDRSLRMGPQVTHVVRQAQIARAILRPVLSSRLPLRTKLMVYKTYVRSRLTYAAPAWYPLISRTNKEKIQAQQNVSLRVITGAGRYVRNDVIARDINVETVEEFITRLARVMYDRADNGPHCHLHNIAPTPARPPGNRPLPRDLLLPEAEDADTTQPAAPARPVSAPAATAPAVTAPAVAAPKPRFKIVTAQRPH